MARRLSVTTRPTAPREARRPLWAASIPSPTEPLPAQIQQFLDWLRIQRNRPPTTVRAYRQDLAKFVAYARWANLGGEVSTVGREELRRYQIELAEILPNARTRARALVALRQFLGYAYDQGWVKAELSRAVVVPKFSIGDPHPVPSDTVPALLAALPSENLRDLRDRAMVYFLISTGCRISEAVALDREQLHPDGIRVFGKGGKHRTVYLTEAAFLAVSQYLQVRDAAGRDRSPALFISVAHADIPGGHALPQNRLTTDGARAALRTLRQRFRSQPLLFHLIEALRTPHSARHTAATTLLEATDGDVRLVQEVLGHATLETLRVYTEITDKRKRQAYQRLGEYLDDISHS